MSKIVLKTTGLKKYYKLGGVTIKALDGIDIQIEEGEFVAITGKSGSGKSTLMHLIGLLDTPSEGQISLNGIETAHLGEKVLAKVRNSEIGFVFQSFNLLSRTSAIENVMLPLRYSDTPKDKWREKSIEMLDLVGLSDRIENKSNELSGGQRQRVAIARALVTSPSIVLADEPTGNLDTKTGDEIEKLFRKLNDQGKTIILVTHDTDLAKIADRQIVLSDGKVISS